MSAYIVSNTHIDAILTTCQKYSGIGVPPNVLTEYGKLLLRQNILSVAYRYAEIPDLQIADEYVFTPYTKELSLIGAIKLCHCLEYQSCETDDYLATDAFARLHHIKGTFIRELPGYDDAKWSIG